MLFHWYLFVFLFIFYLFAKAGNQRYLVYVGGEYESRYKPFTGFIVIAVLTVVAATRDERFIDTSAYISNYMRSDPSWEGIMGILNGDGKDKVFYVTTALLHGLLGDHYKIYLGTIAAFSLLCVISVYRRHSCNFFMTIFLFLASGEYVQWAHNGIRQFVAVGMSFAAVDLLLKKKYLKYLTVILIASTFHASVLVMVPLCFVVQGPAWNTKSVLMILAVIAGASSSDFLLNMVADVMENSQYASEVNQMLSTGGTSFLRVLVFSIPALMSLIFLRRIRALNIPLINLCVNMSIAAMGIYIVSMFTSGIFIGRLPVYCSLYNYLLLPWIIERSFEKSSAKLVMVMAIGCYMVFYYYQMHIIWGLSA